MINPLFACVNRDCPLSEGLFSPEQWIKLNGGIDDNMAESQKLLVAHQEGYTEGMKQGYLTAKKKYKREWISVKKVTPDYNERCLIFDGIKQYLGYLQCHDKDGLLFVTELGHLRNVILWQPLPEKPEVNGD